MKKGMKKMLTMGLTTCLAVMASIPAAAGQWKKLEGGEYWQWRYEEEDGSYPVSSWKKVKSKWYHFDPDGYLDVGWHYIDGNWYYMDDDGAMAEGTEYEGGYLGSDGAWVSKLLPPDNFYVCTPGEQEYWKQKQEDYQINADMFADNGDGSFTLQGTFDPETCVTPDLYNTVLATGALRFNGFTSTFEYDDDSYTFIVSNIKYLYDWE